MFAKNVYFLNFPMGFGVWEGLQWMGNGCGLEMDGFSTHFEPHGSIFNDFHDFVYFALVSGRPAIGFPYTPTKPDM